MEFGNLFILIFIVPWLIVMLYFFTRQRRSIKKLKSVVSSRFIGEFTEYSAFKLVAHSIIITAMGILLVISAAEPGRTGQVDAMVKTDTIIFAIDASFSMVAFDTVEIPGVGKAKNRIGEATSIASHIMEKYPDYKFGLISFSGIAAIHSPPTTDHVAMKNYLKSFRLHMFQKTGTNFKAALGGVIHFLENSRNNAIQVVMLSDGEDKESESYGEEIKILTKKSVPVHAVGIGTRKGSGIYIYDPADLLAGKQKPSIAKNITTRRRDGDLKKISKKTGGIYLVTEKKQDLTPLFDAISKHPGQLTSVKRRGREDLSYIFILLFAVLFITDLLVFDSLKFWNNIGKALYAFTRRLQK